MRLSLIRKKENYKNVSTLLTSIFPIPHLDEIEHSLAHASDALNQDWAKKMLTLLQQRLVMAKQVSLKLQQIGHSLSLEKCM